MSIVNHAPTLTLADAKKIANQFYGLEGDVRELPSERDQNFLVSVGDVRRVLKVANSIEKHSLLEAQNLAMEHVAGLRLLRKRFAHCAEKRLRALL